MQAEDEPEEEIEIENIINFVTHVNEPNPEEDPSQGKRKKGKGKGENAEDPEAKKIRKVKDDDGSEGGETFSMAVPEYGMVRFALCSLCSLCV